MPWPILLAPISMAFFTSLASPFSPACIINGIFLDFAISNKYKYSSNGYLSSAPAKSKQHTPLFL